MFKVVSLLTVCVLLSFSIMMNYIHSVDCYFLEKVSGKIFDGESQKYSFFLKRGYIFEGLDEVSRAPMRLFTVFSQDFAIYRLHEGYIGFVIKDEGLYRTKISKISFFLDLRDLIFVSVSN